MVRLLVVLLLCVGIWLLRASLRRGCCGLGRVLLRALFRPCAHRVTLHSPVGRKVRQASATSAGSVRPSMEVVGGWGVREEGRGGGEAHFSMDDRPKEVCK